MRSMRFWVTAMTRNRRAQNDSRQQSLDFGPVLYAAQVREQQTVTKTLRLLGSNAAATDADLDAARMRARAAVSMLQRHGESGIGPDIEDKLSLLMFCVFDALKTAVCASGKKSSSVTWNSTTTRCSGALLRPERYLSLWRKR